MECPVRKVASIFVAFMFLLVITLLQINYSSVWSESGRTLSTGSSTGTDDWTSIQKQIQKDRKEQLRQRCAALGYDVRSVNKKLDYNTLKKLSRIHVIPQLKVIYCPIPKVASTSWRRFLLAATNHDTTRPVIDSKLLFPSLSSFPLRDAQRILQKYRTFLFVRNPYGRLLSAYNQKLFYQKPKFREIVQDWFEKYDPKEVEGMGPNDTFTFEQFIKHYLQVRKKNAHWEDMMELCHPCEIGYSFIGHLETLKDDADYLMDLLGTSEKLRFPDEERPQTNSSSDATLHDFYSQLANGQYKDLSFSQGLARDALLFGYETPDSIKRS